MSKGSIFVLSFITALSGALMPGPLLTVTIAQSAVMGFLAPVLLIAGHSLLELLLVIGLVFGLGKVLRIKPVIGTISVLGGGVLLWMGGSMIPAALNGALDLNTSASATSAVKMGILDNPVITGMVVSISNPYWVIWWATVGMTLFGTVAQNAPTPVREGVGLPPAIPDGEFNSQLSCSEGSPTPSRTVPPTTGVVRASASVGAFYFGHISGDILWYLILGAAIVSGRAFISPEIYRVVVVICGAFLIFLGASFLYLVASGKLWTIKMNFNWRRE